MQHGLVGIVKGGMAQLALAQVDIMRKERLDQARAGRQVPDPYVAQEDVLVDIDAIPAGDVQGSPFVMLADVRHQGVASVVEPCCQVGPTQVKWPSTQNPKRHG